ncbi:hypothetical protein AQS8620_01875 [Aquimixticola soesokkakensis]|uniref:Uncharacterized protein n=1 Tax=Aquimixticola soesokkakensis TaxID=1519096 RepID=A0A1Y5SR39_9RHOB|nr:hypothetical protein [Aquimixticola soesokkakensis]SLN45812.1 hypothetical protein AQS8620_01875 [Aquimixticola soesokkakensis]
MTQPNVFVPRVRQTQQLSWGALRPCEARQAMSGFVQDEEGAVTADFLGILTVAITLSMTVTGDVAGGAMALGEKISARLSGMSIASTIASTVGSVDDIASGITLGDVLANGSFGFGLGAGELGAGELGNGDLDGADAPGNPGNDHAVGGAGETPNGGDAWGSGSNGMSS